MSREGRMVVVGTVLHEDSLLNELLKSWPSRLYQADVDGSSGCERPLWPQAFTTEDLLEIKKEYTGKGMLDLFFREYFNRIVGNEDALFRKEFFKKISRKYLEDLADQGERVRCFLTIDPAYSGGSGHDWSVLVQTYVDSKNNLYVGDILRGRWAITGTIETLFNLLESKDFDGIGMQKMDWDRVFKVPVLTEQKRRNKFFRIVPLQTYSSLNRGLSSKTNRIARLAPRYSAGTIFHLEEARGISYLEEELLSYPHSRYDDVSDCLAMLLDLAFPAIRKPVKTWTSFPSNPDRDSISGY